MTSLRKLVEGVLDEAVEAIEHEENMGHGDEFADAREATEKLETLLAETIDCSRLVRILQSGTTACSLAELLDTVQKAYMKPELRGDESDAEDDE